MKRINILPPEVISKIAAGEIIERPAAVVKELVENALDAGSSNIELHLKQAGKMLIRIKDNGSGIDAEDLEKLFRRHSTSKIEKIDDLYNIGSLGFRGEALYSIAAISDITLRSKTKASDTGWEIQQRGGRKVNLRPVNMLPGTQIEVKELFFNTPARRKFLKSNAAELNQILNTFIPYTLLYPQHKFTLTHNRKTLVNLAPEENLIPRAAAAMHLAPEHLIEERRNFKEKGISLRLVLSDINIPRVRKDMQFIFINNRPVQNRSLSFHINQAYRLLLPPETYPFFALYIELPGENVDVNTHPTKREVKIKDEYSLASFLHTVCQEILSSRGGVKQIKDYLFPGGNLDSLLPPEETPIEAGPAPLAADKSQPKQYILSPRQQTYIPVGENLLAAREDNLKTKLSAARYIGAFIKKYLLFETPFSLLVIDQHAAQERITYEKLIQQLAAQKLEVQRRLAPIVIRLSAQEMVIWEVIKDKLESIGFSTTLWDNENIALHAHPCILPNPEISLRNLLFGEERTRFDSKTLAQRACRNSLMTGYIMSDEQTQYLREQLLQCQNPFTCPHGRPTVVEIQEKALNKQFLR